ncbi:MAG: thioesterase [Bacteroidetes bacterium]|nr:MAG: thioesterase [Bacteroidota bacterium]
MNNSLFRKQALGPFFWLFLLKKLPLAFIAGVKLKQLDDTGSITQLKFKWINQNPFRSIYFAAMQMAAELATGLLLFQFRDSSPFSMLLVSTQADYHKKAIGIIYFSCNEGQKVSQYIKDMLLNPSGETIKLPVEAKNSAGELVANFLFTWSCKGNKAQK